MSKRKYKPRQSARASKRNLASGRKGNAATLFAIKFSRVYIPFVLVSGGTILFLILFRWLFEFQLQLEVLKEEWYTGFLPLFFPWVPIVIWLRKPLRILLFWKISEDHSIQFQGIIWLLMLFPALVSQNYLDSATDELVAVNWAEEIREHPDKRSFEVWSFEVDTPAVSRSVVRRTSGRSNRNLDFNFYSVYPIKDAPDVWYGLKQEYRARNSRDEAANELAYESAKTRVTELASYHDFKRVSYFKVVPHSDDRDGYYQAILQANPDADLDQQIILDYQLEPFEEDAGAALLTTLLSVIISWIVGFFVLTLPKVSKQQLNHLLQGNGSKGDADSIVVYLDVRGKHQPTAFILWSCILAFGVQAMLGLNPMSPSSEEMLATGAVRGAEVFSGEVWRLLTAVFIHEGAVSLIFALFALGLIAPLLEKLLGLWRLLGCFVLLGICANLFSISFNPQVVCSGAIGAMMGLQGMIGVFLFFKLYQHAGAIGASLSVIVLTGGTLLLGFLPEVNTIAHVGGLVSGVLLGLLLVRVEGDRLRKRSELLKS